jgi:putative ABC transport system permease protein
MPQVPMWRRYLRFFGAEPEADVEDELHFHLDAKVDELIGHGWPSEQARAEARRQFGDLAAVRRICERLRRENEQRLRRAEYFAGWRQDMSYGFRQLRKRWPTTLLAVATLGIGIGGVAAVFSVVDAVVLRPLPFPNANRIVTVWSTRQGQDDVVTPRNFDSWRRDARSFTRLAALDRMTFTLSEGDNPMEIPGGEVTSNFFSVFGVSPLFGRTFTQQEDRPPRLPLAVLSYRLWRERFGSDRGILGRQIHLNRETYTVIGVMPARFDLRPDGEQLWTPLALSGQEMNWTGGVLYVFGRLRPDITLKQTRAEMAVIARILQARYPDMNRGLDIRVRELSTDLIGSYEQQLFILLAAVGSVFLIACVNVANLLLARGAGRIHELTVRAALGATRLRILRQLLTESLLLALAGATAGLLLADSSIRILKSFGNTAVPRLNDASVNGEVLIVVIGLALTCALLSGLLPALRAARLDLQNALAQTGRSASGLARDHARNAYIAIEVGLALVLLVAAGLLIRTAVAAQHIQPGFAANRLVTGRTALPPSVYRTSNQVTGSYNRILEILANEPGVASAALTSKVPLGTSDMRLVLKSNAVVPPLKEELSTGLRFVSAGYFGTMRIPVLRGREFSERDRTGSAQAIIINQTLARRLWPAQGAVGQTIRIPELETGIPAWEVVGVVADVRDDGVMAVPPPVLYVPFAQLPIHPWQWTEQSLYLVARTQADRVTSSELLRTALGKVDSELPLGDVRTMNQRLAQSVSAAGLYTLLLTILGLCGLLLTAAGIYGVVAYFVNRQRAEIGIRLALGATRGAVLMFVLRQGMRPVLAGVGLGLAGSVVTSRALASQLYGIGTTDPLTFGAVACVLLMTGALACYLPARQAAKIDPMIALRSD